MEPGDGGRRHDRERVGGSNHAWGSRTTDTSTNLTSSETGSASGVGSITGSSSWGSATHVTVPYDVTTTAPGFVGGGWFGGGVSLGAGFFGPATPPPPPPSLRDRIGNGINDIVTTITDGANLFSDALGQAEQFVSDVGQELNGAAKDAKEAVTSAADSVGEAFSQAGNWAFDQLPSAEPVTAGLDRAGEVANKAGEVLTKIVLD